MVKYIGIIGEDYKGALWRHKVSSDVAPPSFTMQTTRVVSVFDCWLVDGRISRLLEKLLPLWHKISIFSA